MYMENLAIALKLPMIKLVDGSSGGGSVTTIKSTGFSYVPPMDIFLPVSKQLNMGIPNLGAVVGPAIGLGAARVVACHFSVMAGDIGSLFNAGPQVVQSRIILLTFCVRANSVLQTLHLKRASASLSLVVRQCIAPMAQ